MRNTVLSLAALAATAAVAVGAPAGALAAIDTTAATHLAAQRVARETARIKLPTETARWHVNGCVAHGSECTSSFWIRTYRGGHRTMHCNGIAQVRQHRDGRLYIGNGLAYNCLDR